MYYNRPFILLGILLLRFVQSFQPISAVADSIPNPLQRVSSGTKPSTIVAFATRRKMGVASSKESTDSMTESSVEEPNTVIFSSSLLPADEGEEQTGSTALIVLNYPIPRKSLLLDHLWKTSDIKVAADGGANRLYEYSKDYIPDRIRGDLDSLDAKVRAYYESKDVSVEQDFCQDTNDLDKALQVLVNNEGDGNTKSFDRVVIYGAFGGRFDQEMASFAALYKWAPHFGSQLYLYSDETCAVLIPAKTDCEIRLPFYHDHTIENSPQEIGEGPTCGLIPLGCRCDSVVTQGLKWDLDGSMPLEFGGLVSSSNRIMEPTVKVVSSHPLVFTAELVSKTESN